MMPKDSVPALLRYLVGAACVVVIVAGMKMAAPVVNLILMSLLLAFSISPVQKWLMGIDYALTWAVLSFLFNFIPNIGIVMAILAPATLALLEHGWLRALLVVGGFVAFNFLSDNVLKPRTMKSGLNISPLLTILSVIFWSWVLGAAGTILAVPLTITLQRMVKPQAELVSGDVRHQA